MKRMRAGHRACCGWWAVWLGAWLALSAPWALAQTAPPLPPVERFFSEPDITEAKLSPSGRWIAVTSPVNGRLVLAVYDTRTLKPFSVAQRFGDADIDDFYWVNDERLVFDTVDLQRGRGDQRYWSGLFSVGHDGKDLMRLVRVEEGGNTTGSHIVRNTLSPQHRLLHVPANNGEEVLVGETKFSRGTEFREVLAKRLNVRTGRVTNLSLGVPTGVWRWWFDEHGEPRVVVTRSQGRDRVHWRESSGEAANWRLLGEFDAFNAPWMPRYVDAQGRLYVTTRGGRDGAGTLRRFDFKSGQPEPEPIVSTPGFDFIGGLINESSGGATLGLWVDTDAVTTVWFDARLKALQAEADRRLPGRINILRCRRCAEPDMTVLIRSYSDREPSQYLVYTAFDQRWRTFANSRPDVDASSQATLDFERFAARDGRSIPVWVTRPAGVPAGKPLPTVVLVHGGPWVRGGHWRWDGEAQFLASRGYLVIEPEFRGSTGYGAEHFRAGIKQWGQAMQDDVADAALWAVAKGWADKGRICIAGASYGGYATLMGLIRHGEIYRCGVAWAAVTDPRLMFNARADSDSNEEVRRYTFPELIGDPDKDAAMIDANTPVLHAGRINRPLLLAMGGRDWRVPLVHGERLRDAMREAGKPLDWVLYADEGHGWLKPENRFDFYRRMESFLAQHLK